MGSESIDSLGFGEGGIVSGFFWDSREVRDSFWLEEIKEEDSWGLIGISAYYFGVLKLCRGFDGIISRSFWIIRDSFRLLSKIFSGFSPILLTAYSRGFYELTNPFFSAVISLLRFYYHHFSFYILYSIESRPRRGAIGRCSARGRSLGCL